MNSSDLAKLAAAKGQTKRPLVLVIEDDPSQQKLYSLIAEELGIIPCIVSSCAEGLEAVQFLNFDLIIMDVQMPEMDGITCAIKIQEIEANRGTKTPIIAVTAHAMADDRNRCITAGMDDYISKPFLLSDLKQKIDVWAA